MRRSALCGLLAGLCLLAGCERAPEPRQFTTFAMDTVMSFTLCGTEGQTMDQVQSLLAGEAAALDRLLSATREDSDVSRINRAQGSPVTVAGDTAAVLEGALELCALTGGALDITAYPALRAWGFTQEAHRVPAPEELEALAAAIDYTAVELEGDRVTLPAGMELDLGAAAKGWAGDRLAERVRGNGVPSALLDLGQSTIVAVGAKPDGSPWRVGIRDPRGEDFFAVLELEDQAVGTSGGYQRYFEADGAVYWHILDPETAAPARSGLASVTVVSPSALVCDGLSTALFVMGLEEGARFWRDHPELEFEAVFVTQEGEIYRTAGLEGRFSLAEGHRNREVKVLE